MSTETLTPAPITHEVDDDFEGDGFAQHRFATDGGYLWVNVFPAGWSRPADPAYAVVDTVEVEPACRRQGIATRLYDHAVSLLGPIVHSEWQTVAGLAWSASTGAPRHGDPAHWVTDDGDHRFRIAPEDDEKWDDDDPDRFVVTCEDLTTGETIGQATFIHLRDGHRVILCGDIWVDTAHRRQGVATGMMHHLARSTGKPVDPNGFTPDGLALWQALGWDTYGH